MLYVSKFAAIVAGSLFIAIGINGFLVPFKVLDGGVIGISLIINYLFNVKIGLVIMLCSIPIFFLAWRRNRSIFYNSVYGMLVSSFLIDLLAPLQYIILAVIELSSISSSIVGGFLVGTGIGVMLRCETSTGGTDLLAQFISKYVSMNVGVIIFLMDAVIISVGGLLLSRETFIHSLITIVSGGVATSLCMLKS